MFLVQVWQYEASSHGEPTILEWPVNLSLALYCLVGVNTFLYLREKTILRPKKLDTTKQNLVALATMHPGSVHPCGGHGIC